MKILSWGAIIFFSLFVLCFLIMTISVIIYGDPKVITTDPTDPILDEGYGRYMEKAKYEVYRLVMGKVHFTGWSCGIIGLILNILREYIIKKKAFCRLERSSEGYD